MPSSSPSLPLLLLLALFAVVSAHSNLGKPLPYNRECKGEAPCGKFACPRVPNNSRFSPSKPAETWKRGQKVRIVWHKNNHVHGFYRRSLVPVKHMYKHDWHRKTAFDWGCWTQGSFKCGRNALCGDDKKGRAYQNYITVPSVFPDGDYVFAQVWFGGLDWRMRKPEFSDYYACSFVRIRGGKRRTGRYTGKFVAGEARRKVPPGKCATGSVRPRECGGGECARKKIKFTIPSVFHGGKKPVINANIFGGGALKHGPIAKETEQEKKALEAENRRQRERDAKIGRDIERAEKAAAAKKRRGGGGRNPMRKFTVVGGGKKLVLYGGNRKTLTLNRKAEIVVWVDTGSARPRQGIRMRVPGTSKTLTQRGHPYKFWWKYGAWRKWNNRFVKLTATSGPHKFTAQIKVRLVGGGSKNNRKRNVRRRRYQRKRPRDCSWSRVPKRPWGSWGVRNSAIWRRKMAQFKRRKAYCRRCRYSCKL